MKNPPYSIGADVIPNYEKELLNSLPQLYPDKRERKLVESILIPQFRTLLVQLFVEFNEANKRNTKQTLNPNEIPELCKAVDKMIKTNRKILDVEGLFKPALAEIQGMRELVKMDLEEGFKEQCRQTLASNNISDRQSLIAMGSVAFIKADFPPFGKGKAFAIVVLGEEIKNVTLEHLNRIADILFGKESEEELKGHYIQALARHNITDRQSLITMGPKVFIKTDFPPFGKGTAFAGVILGETGKKVTRETLKRMADALFVKESEEEIKEKYIHALASHNIRDRQSLMRMGSRTFKMTDFPPFGKGTAFAGAILGEAVKRVTRAHLNRIADALFGEGSEEELKERYIHALARHNISDRPSLIAMGPTAFIRADFPPFGKGTAFAGAVLGENIKSVSLDHLKRMADALFGEGSEEELKVHYIQALASNGIHDRQSLIAMGSKAFKGTDFPPFGKGAAFAGAILGETINNVTREHLNRIADVLGLSQLSEETKQQCIYALAQHNITDHNSLIAIGSKAFMGIDFPSFGKGRAFAGAVLGENIRYVTREHLNRIADVLGLSQLSEETKQQCIHALASHNIRDRQSLMAMRTRAFMKADFPSFGKGRAFAGAVLGEAVKRVTRAHLNRIADALFGEESAKSSEHVEEED